LADTLVDDRHGTAEQRFNESKQALKQSRSSCRPVHRKNGDGLDKAVPADDGDATFP
jgi:hypothetical protein